mgnify:CR=1 FL=1
MLPQGSKASFHSHFLYLLPAKYTCKRITPNDSQTDMQKYQCRTFNDTS